MSIHLQPAHCTMFSLHSHFPPGEPERSLLVTAGGPEFSKRRGGAEARYSLEGTTYRVRVSVNRSAKSDTVIDVDYDRAPSTTPKPKPSLDVDKLWKCLEKSSKLPIWHCWALFKYPPTGYNLKYGLPSPIARQMEGFNEIRGVRLARSVEGKVLYSVILDRPENEDIRCSVAFTMEETKLVGLAEEAFRRAIEIVGLVITPKVQKDTRLA